MVLPVGKDPVAGKARQLPHPGDTPGRSLASVGLRCYTRSQKNALKPFRANRPGAQPFGWWTLADARPETEDRWRSLDLSPFVRNAGYLSTHLEPISARRRRVVWCWKEGEDPPSTDMLMQMIPLSPTASSSCEVGTYTQEPGMVTTGDSWLPHPGGHI